MMKQSICNDMKIMLKVQVMRVQGASLYKEAEIRVGVIMLSNHHKVDMILSSHFQQYDINLFTQSIEARGQHSQTEVPVICTVYARPTRKWNECRKFQQRIQV